MRHSRGRDKQGGKLSERDVEIKLPDGHWYRCRQVTIKLKKPTRNGDKTLILLTNLPRSVSAVKIANAYSQRWTIETCLGYLAQALNAEINTLCYPGAAGLCFCLALTLFNIMSTMRALIKKHGKQSKRKPVTDISYYYLALEIAQRHAAIEITVPDEYWKKHAAIDFTTFARFLNGVARHAQLKRYRKHTRGPKKPPPKRKFTGARHVATQKLLDARMTA